MVGTTLSASVGPSVPGGTPITLIRETPAELLSPYLAQHRDNPVDWYSWGEEAFARARQLGRPLFVSVGYSACHWCHVMAHESFEDPATAQLLNEGFVAIKVDREERPDVDAVYIEAVQILTGGAGWPLSIFATPEGRPFYGGTYFPKVRRANFPAFAEVLDAVRTTWAERRPELEKQSLQLSDEVQRRLTPPPLDGGARPPARQLARDALARFAETYDPVNGGVGSAPKFPNVPMLELVLRQHLAGAFGALHMLETSLEAMASGGIYDHLGGGFARYSVDAAWTVPHFEKMLYDQVSLARLYLRAFLVTRDPRWRQVCTETLDYVLRDLALSTGGLASAEDADSEGEEGRFYTWTRDEVEAVLGPQAAGLACAWYGLDAGPNFEDGRSILVRAERGALIRPEAVEAARRALFAARATRVRPGRDDKVLTEWNAMAVSVLAEAAGALDEERYRMAALEIAEFLCTTLRGPDGRWLRAAQRGVAQHLAVAGDYAWLIEAFVRLAELTGHQRWLEEAVTVAGGLDALFSAADGGLYITGADASDLVVRPRDSFDGVLPATTSTAVGALARLGALRADDAFTERARRIADSVASTLVAAPLAFSHLIGAAELLDDGALEIVVAGEHPELVAFVHHQYLPSAVLAWGEREDSALWEGREDGTFVCREGICQAPVHNESALGAAVVMAAFHPELPQ